MVHMLFIINALFSSETAPSPYYHNVFTYVINFSLVSALGLYHFLLFQKTVYWPEHKSIFVCRSFCHTVGGTFWGEGTYYNYGIWGYIQPMGTILSLFASKHAVSQHFFHPPPTIVGGSCFCLFKALYLCPKSLGHKSSWITKWTCLKLSQMTSKHVGMIIKEGMF